MRILLSAYACRPNAGSEPGFGWHWATHLAARGMDVHVLVAQRNRGAIEEGLRTNSIPNLHFTYVAVPYQWAKKSESVHYAFWQRAALQAARELSQQFQFDLAHHVTYGSIHVPTQLWRLGIPVIFGPVGGGQTAPREMLKYFGTEKSREQLRSLATKNLRFSSLHRYWLRQMSFVLAANQDTLSLVRALGCHNASLMCDTGISDNYFAHRPGTFRTRTGPLKLLWVGRILARKALPLALDALKATDENVTLTIAGEDLNGPDATLRMIRERKLERRVFWKGSRLSYQDLRRAYAEHDAMLFTSLRDSFGSQLLEAMAMGLPIITLDLHGAHDHVPAAASIKVPVGKPEETVCNLARAIQEFGSYPSSKKDEMSRKGWEFARGFSWPERAEMTEKLYQETLRQATPMKSTNPKVATASI